MKVEKIYHKYCYYAEEAIKYGKIIGYKLYKEKGGINAEKFNSFYNEFIKDYLK